MGYYIQTDSSRNKAEWIVRNMHGVMVSVANADRPPENHVPVVVINNGPFEAAGIAFDARELSEFAYPDGRPKTFLHVPINEVLRECPFVRELINWPNCEVAIGPVVRPSPQG